MDIIPDEIPEIIIPEIQPLPQCTLISTSQFCNTCGRTNNTYKCKLCQQSTHQKCGNNQNYLLCKACMQQQCKLCLAPGNNEQCVICQFYYCFDCMKHKKCLFCRQLGGIIQSIVSVYIKESGAFNERLMFLVKIQHKSYWHCKLISQKQLKVIKPKLVQSHKMNKVEVICETLAEDFGLETFIPMTKVDYQYDSSEDEFSNIDEEQSATLSNFTQELNFKQTNQDDAFLKQESNTVTIEEFLCGDQKFILDAYPEKLQAYAQKLLQAGVESYYLVPELIISQKSENIFLVKWINLQFSENTLEHLNYMVPYGKTPLIKFFLTISDTLKTNFYKICMETKSIENIMYNNNLVKQLTSIPNYLQCGNKNLYDFQLIGINWLLNAHQNNIGVIFADQMGLGKTIQIACYIATLYHLQCKGPHLIVVPASTLLNWQRELQKWVPFLTVGLVEITDKESIKYYQITKQDIILLSYDTLANLDKRKMMSSFFKSNYPSFQTLICDEGHKIKAGSKTEIYQALIKVNTKQRIILTGTPIQNCFQELLNLLHFVDSSFFNHIKQQQLVQLAQQSSSEDFSVEERITAINKIQEIIKPYMLLRTSKDVFKTPLKKVVTLVPVPLTKKQQMIYASLLFNDRNNLANGKVQTISKTLQNLRHIANHPILLNKNYQHQLDMISNDKIFSLSNKFQVAIYLIQKILQNGRKVVVFSQFTMVLNIFNVVLTRLKLNYLRIDGTVATQQRQILIDRFSNSTAYNIFLISTTSGGLGINLQAASDLIFYDASWNPQIDVQAEYRALRIGQKNLVRIYKLCSQDTVDEAIIQRANQKLQLSNIIVGSRKGETEADQNQEIKEILKYGSEKILKQFNKAQLQNEAQQYKQSGIMLDGGEIMSGDQLKEYEKLLFQEPEKEDSVNILKLQKGSIDQKQFFQAFNATNGEQVQDKQLVVQEEKEEILENEDKPQWADIFTDIFGEQELQLEKLTVKGPRFNLDRISSESDQSEYESDIYYSDPEPVQKQQKQIFVNTNVDLVGKGKPIIIKKQNEILVNQQARSQKTQSFLPVQEQNFIKLDLNNLIQNPGDYLNIIQQVYDSKGELQPNNEIYQQQSLQAGFLIKENKMLQFLFQLALQTNFLPFQFQYDSSNLDPERSFYQELLKQRSIQQQLLNMYVQNFLNETKENLKQIDIKVEDQVGYLYNNVITQTESFSIPDFQYLQPELAQKIEFKQYLTSRIEQSSIKFFKYNTTCFFTFAPPSSSPDVFNILKIHLQQQIDHINKIKQQTSIVKALEFIVLVIEFRRLALQIMLITQFAISKEIMEITKIDLSQFTNIPSQYQTRTALRMAMAQVQQKMPHINARLEAFFNIESIPFYQFNNTAYLDQLQDQKPNQSGANELFAALYVLSLEPSLQLKSRNNAQLFKVQIWNAEFKRIQFQAQRQHHIENSFKMRISQQNIEKINGTINSYISQQQNMDLLEKKNSTNVFQLLSLAAQLAARYYFGVVKNPASAQNRATSHKRTITFFQQVQTRVPSGIKQYLLSLTGSKWAILCAACIAHHIAEFGLTRENLEGNPIHKVLAIIRSKVTSDTNFRLKHVGLSKDLILFFNSQMPITELIDTLLMVVGISLAFSDTSLSIQKEFTFEGCWLQEKLEESGLINFLK